MGLPSFNSYYVSYKLTMVVDKHKLWPLDFLLHEGSPNDAKLFERF